jgi:hypothetical protein
MSTVQEALTPGKPGPFRIFLIGCAEDYVDALVKYVGTTLDKRDHRHISFHLAPSGPFGIRVILRGQVDDPKWALRYFGNLEAPTPLRGNLALLTLDVVDVRKLRKIPVTPPLPGSFGNDADPQMPVAVPFKLVGEEQDGWRLVRQPAPQHSYYIFCGWKDQRLLMPWDRYLRDVLVVEKSKFQKDEQGSVLDMTLGFGDINSTLNHIEAVGIVQMENTEEHGDAIQSPFFHLCDLRREMIRQHRGLSVPLLFSFEVVKERIEYLDPTADWNNLLGENNEKIPVGRFWVAKEVSDKYPCELPAGPFIVVSASDTKTTVLASQLAAGYLGRGFSVAFLNYVATDRVHPGICGLPEFADVVCVLDAMRKQSLFAVSPETVSRLPRARRRFALYTELARGGKTTTQDILEGLRWLQPRRWVVCFNQALTNGQQWDKTFLAQLKWITDHGIEDEIYPIVTSQTLNDAKTCDQICPRFSIFVRNLSPAEIGDIDELSNSRSSLIPAFELDPGHRIAFNQDSVGFGLLAVLGPNRERQQAIRVRSIDFTNEQLLSNEEKNQLRKSELVQERAWGKSYNYCQLRECLRSENR